MDEGGPPAKCLNFMPDRDTSSSKAILLPSEKNQAKQIKEYESGGNNGSYNCE